MEVRLVVAIKPGLFRHVCHIDHLGLPLLLHGGTVGFRDFANAVQVCAHILCKRRKMVEEIASSTRARRNRKVVAPLLKLGNAGVLDSRETRRFAITFDLTYKAMDIKT